MGAILHHISYACFTKNDIFDTFKMKNDSYKNNLKTQLGNIVFPYQHTPAGQKWWHCHKLCRVNGHNLVIWPWNPLMPIGGRPSFVWFFCKVCENSSLSFFLATSGHKRSRFQRISFFEYIFKFFEFFEKMAKMVGMAIHWKGSNFQKLSTDLW